MVLALGRPPLRSVALTPALRAMLSILPNSGSVTPCAG